jgi:hypothetical protein
MGAFFLSKPLKSFLVHIIARHRFRKLAFGGRRLEPVPLSSCPHCHTAPTRRTSEWSLGTLCQTDATLCVGHYLAYCTHPNARWWWVWNSRWNDCRVSQCPPRISHGLNWDRISVPTVGSQRLTGWAMARPRWQDSTKMGVGEKEWYGVDWINLAWDRGHWRALVNMVIKLLYPWNVGEFFSSWVRGTQVSCVDLSIGQVPRRLGTQLCYRRLSGNFFEGRPS